ncbi:MAG TPA: carboxypeptidase-like regulatory domain-containing protein [Candidatus Angelobacter sp.]
MKSWFFVLILTCGIGFTQETNSKSAKKTDPESCTVSGRVVKKTTGEPLKSARILLREDTATRGHAYTEFTDAMGQFTFKNVAPGRYNFEAHRNGYVEQNYLPEGAGSAAILELIPGQKLDKVLFRLTAAAAVVGRIVDEDGDPAPAIVVQVLQEESNGSKKVLDPVARALTDDLGQFRLFGIPPGQYYFNTIDSGTPDISPIDFIQGLRNFSNDEAAAKRPSIYYPGVLRRDQAQKITLKAGEEFHLDLALRPAKSAFTVAGIVIGPSGSPVAGAGVYLNDMNEDESTTLSHNSATTDAKGHFLIKNVFSSNYLISTSLYDKERLYSGMESIDVTSENVTNVRLVLKAPGSITGTVVAQESSDFIFQSMFVGAIPTDTANIGAQMAGGMIQKDGTFKIDLLESTYWLRIQGLPEGWYLHSARLDGEDVLQHGMKIQGAAPQKLELQISHTAASLTGTVSMEEKLVIGAAVKLVPINDNPYRGDLVKSTNTDQNGHFVLASIVPGAYKVIAKPGNDETQESTEPDHKKVEINVELHESEARAIKLEINAEEHQ